VKVIPLGEESQSSVGEEKPDCSSCEDVKREIEITKRMTGLEGGGFVTFLG